MAASLKLFLFIFPLSFFFSHVLFASSLSPPPPPQTTTLDISSSLKQAEDILSLDPLSFKPLATSQSQLLHSNSSSPPACVFSILLHSRASLHKTDHTDYKALILSRLHRDSARFHSLTTKLLLPLNGVQKSQILPYELSTPIISGTSLGSGEYFSRVGVGRPGTILYGSRFRKQCSSLDVSSCDSGKCLYHVLYGDGSYTMGEFVTETLSFGNSGEVNNVALGCGKYNTGLFAGAAGLLGLGGGSLSLTSQIKATSFSYCLVDRDSASSSTLDFNSGLPADSVIAPLIRNQKVDTFYYVRLTGFSAYNALRDAFVKLAQDLPITSGVALFDTCYDSSSMSEVSVPTVSFRFGSGRSLDLPAKNYLVPVDSEGTFCLAFALTSSSLSIIGNVQQQGIRVSFDLANNKGAGASSPCGTVQVAKVKSV
ncbi:hypothetical protein Gohar_006781 [Gossypium harknessii]|uniref:Peptidase A1 domain-containing protein n=1 Tax=Gossypium harknessii TaxID=34285 RepID=A0A7J9GEH7_9ROSI|nr:hypothetical protein [Gossypium harknessii]